MTTTSYSQVALKAILAALTRGKAIGSSTRMEDRAGRPEAQGRTLGFFHRHIKGGPINPQEMK